MTIFTLDPSALPDNPVQRGLWLLKRMREAGVPVIGVLAPESVESGRLIIEAPDLGTGEIVWRWGSRDKRRTPARIARLD